LARRGAELISHIDDRLIAVPRRRAQGRSWSIDADGGAESFADRAVEKTRRFLCAISSVRKR